MNFDNIIGNLTILEKADKLVNSNLRTSELEELTGVINQKIGEIKRGVTPLDKCALSTLKRFESTYNKLNSQNPTENLGMPIDEKVKCVLNSSVKGSELEKKFDIPRFRTSRLRNGISRIDNLTGKSVLIFENTFNKLIKTGDIDFDIDKTVLESTSYSNTGIKTKIIKSIAKAEYKHQPIFRGTKEEREKKVHNLISEYSKSGKTIVKYNFGNDGIYDVTAIFHISVDKEDNARSLISIRCHFEREFNLQVKTWE